MSHKIDARDGSNGRTKTPGAGGVNRRNVLSTLASAGASTTILGSAAVANAASCDYALRAVYGPNVSSTQAQRTIDAVESLKDQINSRTDKDAITLDPYQTGVDASDYDSECGWFSAVASDMDWSYDVTVKHHDIVLAGHLKWLWGFGKSCGADLSGDRRVVGGVHYVGDQTNYAISKNIGIMEVGHQRPWWTGHSDGDVDVNDNNVVTGVSPMATSYVYDTEGATDTSTCALGSGGGNVPDEFCWGEDNRTFYGFDCPVHDDSISYCYENNIWNDDGNFSSRC